MEILKLNSNKKEAIKKTALYIKEGKVVVFPTDTVYGIICDAKNKKAVNKIFRIKKRSVKKILPLFVKDIKMAKKIAKINKAQETFLKKAWPGKVTAILKKKPVKIYGVDKKTIALRVSNSKEIALLIKKINSPLAQTSANISTKKTGKTAKEIIETFKKRKEKPDLLIDNSALKNKESVLIDLTKNPPQILRA